MSIKGAAALAFAAAVLIGSSTALLVRSSELRAEYPQTIVSYEEADIAVRDMQQAVSQASALYAELETTAVSASERMEAISGLLAEMTEAANRERAKDAEHREAVDALVDISKEQSQETEDVLATVLSNLLGKPIGQTFGERANVKVFSLKEAGYQGYLAKVKLHDPNAVKLVLSNDKIGDKGETTSSAAERTGAVLAINAGGFSKDKKGLLYPMGATVVDGEIVAFYQTGLSFIGFNKEGELVGGDIQSREDLEELDVQNGATFVPTLLKDGKKQKIPAKWKNKKEPRTMIGHFSNGDLLFIVIDGRQEGYSNGVTLEEAQTKLLEWNVRDAYNLDGGGSSAFVFNGELLNYPSDGRERKVVSNFVVLP